MTRSHFFLMGLLLTAVACGSNSPTSPSPQGSPGPSAATITISATGIVSPATVDVNVGQSVTIVNNDSRNHEIASDPHPSHTDCPTFDVLTTPGQTKISNAFTTAKTCGFHDHLNPSDTNLLGQVRVH